MTRDRRMKGTPLPFDATAWLEDGIVAGLSLEAAGAFTHLLAHAWNDDGLPDDRDVMRRLARATPSEWKRIWKQIEPLWLVGGDKRRRNARQERDRDAIMDAKARRGAASAAANEAKKGLRSRTDSVSDSVTQSVTDSVANRWLNGGVFASDSTPERTSIGSSPASAAQLQSLTPQGVELAFGDQFQTEPFRSAWARWCAHLRAKRGREVTFSPQELQALGERLRGLGHDAAIDAIEHSIGSGWVSIQAQIGSDRGPNRSPNRSPIRTADGGRGVIAPEFEKAFPGLANEVGRG